MKHTSKTLQDCRDELAELEALRFPNGREHDEEREANSFARSDLEQAIENVEAYAALSGIDEDEIFPTAAFGTDECAQHWARLFVDLSTLLSDEDIVESDHAERFQVLSDLNEQHKNLTRGEDEPTMIVVNPTTDTEALAADSAYKSEWVAKSGAWKVEEWTRKEGTERSVVICDGQCMIAEMNCDDAPAPVEVPNPYTWSYEEAKQHAKVMAAAPDLLQVAQEALAAIESAHEALHEDFKASGLYKDADEINSLDAMMELSGQIVPLTEAIAKAEGRGVV